MNGDYDPIEPVSTLPPRRPFLRKAALPAVAFLLGLGVMGYLLAHWEAGARLLGISAPAPQEQTKQQTPDPQPPQQVVQYLPPAADPSQPGTPTEQDFARRLALLEQRFGTIDTSSRVAVGSADRTEALVAAIAARRAIDRGVALGILERILQLRFPNQQREVGAIITAARQPVTLAQLESELDALGPQLTGAPPDQSWWASFRQELGSLIVIRSAETPSAEPSQRLDRARRWLQGGEINAAVAEVQRMPGRDYAADWVAKARRYALAHWALDRIETAALLEPHAPPAAPQPAPPQAQPQRPATQPARPAARPAARPPARTAQPSPAAATPR